MEIYKNPVSLFKQTNFSKTIWWQLKVNISGYQNETEDKLVTEIFKNRIFRLIYPNIYQNNHKFSRILVQLYEDGYICWINLDGLIIEKYELNYTRATAKGQTVPNEYKGHSIPRFFLVRKDGSIMSRGIGSTGLRDVFLTIDVDVHIEKKDKGQ